MEDLHHFWLLFISLDCFMNKQEFEAVIEKPPKTPGAYIVIPFDVREVYGTEGRVQVKAAFNGYAYRASLAPMGGGRHVLGVRKDIQQAIGKTHGDRVKVVIERDTEPRVVIVPKDLQKLLDANPKGKAFFEKLSFTNRKEYVNWIESAKKEETRQRRLKRSLEMLVENVKHP